MLEPISDIRNVKTRVQSGGVIGAFTFLAVQQTVQRLAEVEVELTTEQTWDTFNHLVRVNGECTIMGVINSEIDKLNGARDATSMVALCG